jgi:hypothetical protein
MKNNDGYKITSKIGANRLLIACPAFSPKIPKEHTFLMEKGLFLGEKTGQSVKFSISYFLAVNNV